MNRKNVTEKPSDYLLTPQERNDFIAQFGGLDTNQPLNHNIKGKFCLINKWEKFGIATKNYNGFTYLKLKDRETILKIKFKIFETPISQQIAIFESIIKEKQNQILMNCDNPYKKGMIRSLNTFIATIEKEIKALEKVGIPTTSPDVHEFPTEKLSIDVTKMSTTSTGEYPLAQINSQTEEIRLNLSQIFKMARHYNYDFYKKLCGSITHEYLHLWLDKEVGFLASHLYDNLYHKVDIPVWYNWFK